MKIVQCPKHPDYSQVSGESICRFVCSCTAVDDVCYCSVMCVCSQCVNIICGCVEPTCVGSLPVSIDMYVLIKLSTYIIFNANMITKNNNTQY